MDISRYFRSLADISRYFILVEFSRIVKSVESSGFLRCGVNISGNFRLNRFPKFWFGVKVVYYKTFLLTTGGGK